jgi:hypothetical protein
VVQWQWRLAHIQETMVRFRPGLFENLQKTNDGSVGNRQTTLAQTQGCCGFDSHLSYFSHALVEQRSARLPVTQDDHRSAAVPAVQIRSGVLKSHGVPVRHKHHASAGHWRAQVAVTHPQFAMRVQLLPDALTKARSSIG